MSMPLVTVIVAAYQAADFIDIALQSVARQTVDDWECVVVDDGSTDRTFEKLTEWTRKDSRFRVFSAGANSGPASARNICLDQAKGTWITVLDADDAFEPDRLAFLLDAAEKLSVDLVFDNQWLLYPHGTRRRWLAIEDRVLRRHGLLRFLYQVSGFSGQHWGIAQPLFRRSLLLNPTLCYESGLRFGEDALFMAQLIGRAGQFGLSGRPGYVYRFPAITTNNLSLAKNVDPSLSTRLMIESLGSRVGIVGRALLRLRLAHYERTAWRDDLLRFVANRQYFRAIKFVALQPPTWLWILARTFRNILP